MLDFFKFIDLMEISDVQSFLTFENLCMKLSNFIFQLQLNTSCVEKKAEIFTEFHVKCQSDKLFGMRVFK